MINLLRFALAAIWTEAEEDNPNIEHIQQIVDEALEMTKEVERGKVPSLSRGLESWIEFKERCGY